MIKSIRSSGSFSLRILLQFFALIIVLLIFCGFCCHIRPPVVPENPLLFAENGQFLDIDTVEIYDGKIVLIIEGLYLSYKAYPEKAYWCQLDIHCNYKFLKPTPDFEPGNISIIAERRKLKIKQVSEYAENKKQYSVMLTFEGNSDFPIVNDSILDEDNGPHIAICLNKFIYHDDQNIFIDTVYAYDPYKVEIAK